MKNSLSVIVSRPAYEFTSSTLASIMTASFEGYIVPQVFDAKAFDSRFRREGLDLSASRVIEIAGEPVGLILVARRGWTARVAALAIAPLHRRCGLGRIALGQTIEHLSQLGDRRLTLEVIETNDAALRLYQSLGFVVQRRLVGYRRTATKEGQGCLDSLVDADPRFIARRVADEGTLDLPWQLASETLACMTAPARGLSFNGAAFAIIEPFANASAMALRTLYVARGLRRRGFGSALVGLVAAAHPNADLVIPATLPEELSSAFLFRVGFQQTDISQFEMVRRLST